ncbi:hypothetical protein ACV3PA_09425 [Exiguobacterium acetylicum]|uniref:hypothetical protein n=1 Tax=Exiguobacterium sp. BMC-KP TaxID=1684312 RepID=UPI0006AA0DB7|nr:hypothetical protein [Exiguobacterium sp. BMC-KP]KOP29420.1 hypothetical protein ADM98_11105 [Exiguobacterium sp. BMC-KP]
MYSDTDLLHQIKRRDPVALERLYDRYEKTLFLLFRRTQVDEALIHSAMTELFRTVWEQPARYPNFQGFILHTLRQLSNKREATPTR